jgi:hypothetical protein
MKKLITALLTAALLIANNAQAAITQDCFTLMTNSISDGVKISKMNERMLKHAELLSKNEPDADLGFFLELSGYNMGIVAYIEGFSFIGSIAPILDKKKLMKDSYYTEKFTILVSHFHKLIEFTSLRYSNLILLIKNEAFRDEIKIDMEFLQSIDSKYSVCK